MFLSSIFVAHPCFYLLCALLLHWSSATISCLPKLGCCYVSFLAEYWDGLFLHLVEASETLSLLETVLAWKADFSPAMHWKRQLKRCPEMQNEEASYLTRAPFSWLASSKLQTFIMVGALVISPCCMDYLLAADTMGFCAGMSIGCLSSDTDFLESVGTLLVLRRLSLCQVPLTFANMTKRKKKKRKGNRQMYQFSSFFTT